MSKEQLFTLSYIWIGMACIIFLINLFIKAPYGRHIKSGWGSLINNKTGWLLMELPALVVCPLFFFMGNGPKGYVALFAIILWLIHYVHRTLIYPFRIKTRGKKIPLSIVAMALVFNCVNGFLCGYYLGNLAELKLSGLAVSGILLFGFGMVVNLQSDSLLINLRKPAEQGYKIPEGGFFKWISCPNMFGEILEWMGFAILTWAAPTLSFAVWTAANLIPRALAHHRWYKEKFKDYPEERKAVIPFVL